MITEKNVLFFAFASSVAYICVAIILIFAYINYSKGENMEYGLLPVEAALSFIGILLIIYIKVLLYRKKSVYL